LSHLQFVGDTLLMGAHTIHEDNSLKLILETFMLSLVPWST
jgi:hypothetical protein